MKKDFWARQAEYMKSLGEQKTDVPRTIVYRGRLFLIDDEKELQELRQWWLLGY